MPEFEAYTSEKYVFLEEIMEQIAREMYPNEIRFRDTNWQRFIIEAREYAFLKSIYLRVLKLKIDNLHLYYNDNIREMIFQLTKSGYLTSLKIMFSQICLVNDVDFVIECAIDSSRVNILLWSYHMNHQISNREIINRILDNSNSATLIQFCEHIEVYPNQEEIDLIAFKSQFGKFTIDTLRWCYEVSGLLPSIQFIARIRSGDFFLPCLIEWYDEKLAHLANPGGIFSEVETAGEAGSLV